MLPSVNPGKHLPSQPLAASRHSPGKPRSLGHRSFAHPSSSDRMTALPRHQSSMRQVAAGISAPPRDADTAVPSQPEPDTVSERGQAVVVGAGPAGCVMAMYLARQGFSVRVLEKRPELVHSEDVAKKTFIMTLMPRGVNVLKELEIKMPEGRWLNGLAPAKGAVMHSATGKEMQLRPYPATNITAERAALAVHLYNEAQRLYPQIQFGFEVNIKDINLGSKSLAVEAAGSRQELKYDILIGADGAGSQVRAAVQQQEPKFTATRDMSSVDYFVFRDLPNVAGICPEDDSVGQFGRYVHMFPSATGLSGPGPILSLGAYIHEDDTYSAALQLNRGWKPPADAAEAERILKDALPGIPDEWVKVGAQQLAGAETKSWGSRVECSHLAVPWAGVALIGDAGHGVTPNLGQGCNAALESAALLDKVLAVNAKDLTHALAEYDRVRKPDMEALQELDKISGRMWSPGGPGINWVFAATLANIWVSGFLHKLMPGIWGPPAMLYGFSRMALPYQQFIWQRRRDLALLAAAFVAVVALAAEVVKRLIAAW